MSLERRMELYRQGFGDTEISKITGEKRNTIAVWRINKGLPSNKTRGYGRKLDRAGSAEGARRMLFYQLGWSDKAIAKAEQRDKTSIREWRQARGLPANFSRGETQRWRPRPTMNDVYRRIRRAVGAKIGRENVDDAVADISLALLDGTISLDEIEQQARRYGNRVLEQFASKWGPRSLDKELTDESGFTLLDTLVDERSSDWLEEMGATAWC